MNENSWSKSSPKLDGFYWLRRAGKKDTIVGIRDVNRGIVEFGAMVVWIGSDWDSSLCDVIRDDECQWSGPIYPAPQ